MQILFLRLLNNMDIFKQLRQPYPSYMLDMEKSNTTSLIVAAAVFLILILLQPFGIELLPWSLRFREALIFSTISGVFCRLKLFLNGYLINKQIFKEEKWTIGIEILYQIGFLFGLGVINWITGHFEDGCLFTQQFFLRWQRETFSVGIFPVSMLIFLRQYNLLKKYSSSANTIDAMLTSAEKRVEEEKIKSSSPLISFSDDSSTNSLPINPVDITYIEAADNYIRINYMENKQVKGLLVRSTLKTAEKKLEGLSNFYRCHRSYLVNLNLIRHISGNATGYKLHLEGVTDLIPVSRNLNTEINDKINAFLLS